VNHVPVAPDLYMAQPFDTAGDTAEVPLLPRAYSFAEFPKVSGTGTVRGGGGGDG